MAQLAKGLSLSIGDGGAPTEVFTPIVNILDFNLSGTTWDTEDITCVDSASRCKHFQPTLRNDGQLTITILTDGDDIVQQALRTLSASGTDNNFRVHYAGSTLGTVDFTAFVNKYQILSPVNGIEKTVVAFQIDGAMRDTAASVQALTITDTAGPAYITGETMTLAARFDEVVVVTGTPRVPIVLTSGTVYATYASGSGTNVLTFSKTFGGGDAATATHVTISSPIQLNSGTIKDQAAQAAVLTFTPPTTTTLTVN